LEELLFRGILQRWLAQRAWGGTAAVVAAIWLASWFAIPELRAAVGMHDWSGAARALAPVWFVLVLAPGALLLQRRSRVGAAIYGTALVFGTAHAAVWPTP